MQLNVPIVCRGLALVLLACAPTMANAYLGPGVGLGAISAILGVIGSAFLAVFAAIWYPIKRFLRRRRRAQADRAAGGAEVERKS